MGSINQHINEDIFIYFGEFEIVMNSENSKITGLKVKTMYQVKNNLSNVAIGYRPNTDS